MTESKGKVKTLFERATDPPIPINPKDARRFAFQDITFRNFGGAIMVRYPDSMKRDAGDFSLPSYHLKKIHEGLAALYPRLKFHYGDVAINGPAFDD